MTTYPILTGSTVEYDASGAIDPRASVVKLTKAGIAAMTLADPETGYDGHIMTIWSSTANADTVTNTTGFGGASTAKDVATSGGAIGNSMTIRADGGVWVVVGLNGYTLG